MNPQLLESWGITVHAWMGLGKGNIYLDTLNKNVKN